MNPRILHKPRNCSYSLLCTISQFNAVCADILSDFQHDFRRRRITMSPALQFVRNVLEKINEKSQATGVFLDLSRAFVRVHHDAISSKIAKSGVTGKLMQLLETYLKGSAWRLCTIMEKYWIGEGQV
ncbi:uncharacterized protein LOC124613826 [Schistocerca americana]|uniref:uncharacterized protein LOC124613826 n=1 Tax=Schistocerca americana TaxID=7009 RepID=UPI001F5021C4|nr:uncharacterized protein LOC124613826 [Schistocerca americana]